MKKEYILDNYFQTLAQHCAYLEARDHLNQTVLHYACKNGQLEVVKYLLSKDVYVNPAAGNKEVYSWKTGRVLYSTPLDMAISNHHSDIVKILKSKGGLTMEKIIRMAVTRIQALYRSYRIRKSFIEHRDLLLRHERLRKQRRRKGQQSREANDTNDNKKVHNAGSFLGHVIEETYNTAAASQYKE